MIGNCDCCDRKGVPVARVNAPGEPIACFICQGDSDPDPYGELSDDPGQIADELDLIPGNNFQEAYALQTAADMLRRTELEKPKPLTYHCTNRCDDYQFIRTTNPFANCGRCGSRLMPLLPRRDE